MDANTGMTMNMRAKMLRRRNLHRRQLLHRASVPRSNSRSPASGVFKSRDRTARLFAVGEEEPQIETQMKHRREVNADSYLSFASSQALPGNSLNCRLRLPSVARNGGRASGT